MPHPSTWCKWCENLQHNTSECPYVEQAEVLYGFRIVRVYDAPPNTVMNPTRITHKQR